MNEPLLQHINSPSDVKKLNKDQLPQLCRELRQQVLEEFILYMEKTTEQAFEELLNRK